MKRTAVFIFMLVIGLMLTCYSVNAETIAKGTVSLKGSSSAISSSKNADYRGLDRFIHP